MILYFLRLLGGSLGRLACLLGIRREVTRSNLRRALPELTEGERRGIEMRAFASLGKVFFEFLFLRFASRQRVADGLVIRNLAEVSHVFSNPRGALLLSGHIGNWEWLAIGTGLNVRPINVIVKEQRNQRIAAFLRMMRTRFGNTMIDVSEMRRVVRALGGGQLVALLGDQASFAESVAVPFFGSDVPTFEGAARLALRMRSPLLFLAPVARTQAGYECVFHEVPFDDLEGITDENVRILTARHTALLEQTIRTAPELWLWQHRRWKYVN